MTNREIFVRLKADASQFKKELEDASSKTRASVDKLSTSAGLMGAAMVAGVGLAAKSFADFDQQMSGVQAATMETAGNMELLRDAAIKAGADTAFSAGEAAQGIEELAKAGVSTADILNGGLNGALDLAAAGGIGVAESAETAASALTQFGLKGEDVSHVADLLAAGATSAQGGVSDLSAALNQSGLVAAQMGLSIEETVGALTLFASAGLTGSDAGTSFRAMLLRLANPTGDAKRAMEDLGIEVYNASGEFVGMESLAGQLSEQLGKVDQQTRNAALATIFGQDAIRTSSILYERGAEGVAEYASEVDRAGFAAEQAAIRLDNLKGDLEALGGSIETALIGAGEGADGPLRATVQTATDLVNVFSSLPPELQQVLTLITGTSGLALVGAAGIAKVATVAADTKAAMADLNIATGKVTGAMKALGGAVAVVGIAVLVKEIEAFLAVDNVMKVGVDDLATSLDRLADGANTVPDLGALFENRNAMRWFVGDIETADDALKSFADQAQQALGPGFQDRFDRFFGDGGVSKFGEQVRQIDGALAMMVANGNAEGAAKALDMFMDAAEERGVLREDLRAMFSAYPAALDAVKVSAEGAAPQIERMAEAEQAAAEAMSEWMSEVAESDSSFVGLLTGYQAVIDKNREAAQATADSTKSSKDSWEDYYDGFSVGLQDYLAELEAQVQAQTNWEANMLLLSGRVSQGVLDELGRLGPEGAPLVADLVNASDEELARLEAVYGQRSDDATGAFAENLRAAGPILAEIMGTAGKEAADEAAAKLASGEATLQQVIDQYDLDFAVDANTGAAISKIQALWNTYDGRAIDVYVNAIATSTVGGAATSMLKRAAGGYISGPGSSTSDSIPARLSNGEYVVKASAVKQYGRSFFDAVNAQRFAAGGYAQQAPTPAPQQLSGMGDRPIEVTTQVVLDTRVVAESIRRYDRALAR